MSGDFSALSRCAGDADAFTTHTWGRRAHLHHGADIDGLLALDDVDHILSSMALRAPAFRLIKAGTTLDLSTYTRRARIGSRTITDLIDVGRLYGHFADGATIVLQGLHRYWAPVAELCRQLEDELTHPVQANAYVTPPVAQGLRVHADSHDVFALQTHGTKQWVVYEDGDGGHPGRGVPSEDAPTLDITLKPGDCLYLPKGVRHAARTVDNTSIHLTLGVRRVTWADVISQAVERMKQDPSLDEALPAGFARNPETLTEEARRRLSGIASALPVEASDAVHTEARRFWTGRTPALSGQLQQVLAADDVHDGTAVQRRPHLTCEIAPRGDLVEVVLADRTLRMPAVAESALRAGLRGEVLRVGDLGGDLDATSRITLVRRLVREGVLIIVDG